MKFMGKVLLFLACTFLPYMAMAQSSQANSTASPASTPSTIPDHEQLTTLVQQQFGKTFTVSQKFAVLTADFDSDGVEDIAIVADSKEPLPDSYAFKYEVADPYHAFFGFGDPRIMSSFNADPDHTHHLLIIFGTGKEAWHAAVPKAKFVLVNVPFDSVEVGRMLVSKKKPPIFMIKALEARLMDSAVFWDAKKKRWRWQPGDTIQ